MITKHNSPLIISVLFLLCFSMNHNLSEGADSITVSQSLFANQTIVSAAGIFELGFFTPGNSSRYYVGIWYKNISQRTYVWVANREPPISDINSAELKISDGNLVLSDNTRVSIWSTNLNSTTSNSVIATLHDNGNLVLHDGSISNSNDEGFWQSFDYPVDTWLPGGKIAYDKRRRTKQLLISWKNSEDPAPGLFSLEFDPIGRQYVIRWNRTKQYWTSGAWNGHIFSLVPEMSHNDIYNLTYVDNDNETYLTYSLYNHSIISRATMDISGQLKMTRWSGSTKEWTLFWSQPTQCQVYAYCGAFGICSHNSLPSCSCLPGFTQKSVNDWDLRDYSRGCEREFHLQQCGNDSAASSMRQDRFLVTTNVSLPENSQNVNSSVGECEFICLNICSCKAYTYDGNTCSVWNGELLNLQRLSGDDGSGRTINVRLAASALSKEVNRFTKGDLIATVACSIAFVIALLAIVGTVIRRRKRRILETTEEIQGSSVVNLELWGDYSTGIGVPFVSWESILAATDNFSDVHKLGRGGFGPVYKGTFPGGKEVAVKRLSSLSTQGFNEFQNEVVLITKLQHRNLVRLVGYCITENEKILLYEYLPNKSLDVFIFDKKLSILLNWRKRYEIILGIARGVLYLHRDSRLTIIHRDLKTSNILLDEDMNPKISDFGLARIFEEDKGAQANTNRVVGTYGYMSPEYATYGIFSMKLDAFGFGVIILEIISGKKNTGFYQSTEAMNLLSYAWKLWTENRALDLLDPILVEFCEKSEVVKCINIGLLCVEEDPVARPTMSNAVLMLSGETTVVPVPNQPAFAMRRHVFNTSPSSSNKPDCISNELTMSAPQGR